MAEAEKWMSIKDFAFICRMNIDDFSDKRAGPEALIEYRNFEKSLREELILFRRTPEKEAGHKRTGILSYSLLEGSPLEVEKRLLFLRWEFIEEKEQGHYFDLEALGLYFLKLQILERMFIFDKEKGTVIFDSLCEVKI